MKILHYLPVVFSYLLACTLGITACGELAQAFARLQAGGNVWSGTSGIVGGLLSLGLTYFLWRWAGSVRANARTSLLLKKRLAQD